MDLRPDLRISQVPFLYTVRIMWWCWVEVVGGVQHALLHLGHSLAIDFFICSKNIVLAVTRTEEGGGGETMLTSGGRQFFSPPQKKELVK